MSRQSALIRVSVHFPATKEGTKALALSVADVHADMISYYIQKLNCPSDQKLRLLNAVIASKKRESPE